MANNNNIQYTMSLRDLNVASTLNNAEGAADRFESKLGGIKTAAVLAATAIAAIGAAAIKSIIEAGSSVETTRIALTNMLGSAKDAGEVISNTMKDAAATPFDFTNLLTANKMLIGAQVEASKAREDVLNLANAVASTGGGNDELNRMVGNLTQIKNVGQATAVDIKQFAFANINIYRALANQMGITTEKLKKQLDDGLVITYDNITEALKKAHEAGGLYAGGLEALSDSTTVKISAIGDALFQLKVRIFDDLKPAIDASITWIQSFVGSLGTMWDQLKNSSEVSGISTYFSGIKDQLLGIWENIKMPLAELFAAISEWRQPILDLLTAMGQAFSFVLGVIGQLLPHIINITTWVIKLLKNIYDILEKLQFFSALKIIFQGIGEAIKIIGDVIQWVYENQIKPIVEAIELLVSGTKELIGMTDDINKGLAPTPQGINNMLYGTPSTANQSVWASNAVKAAKPSSSSAPSSLGKTTGTKGAAGQKILNITINIGSLIKDGITLQVTNLTEGSGKIKEMVQQALLSAVNDSQLVPER